VKGVSVASRTQPEPIVSTSTKPIYLVLVMLVESNIQLHERRHIDINPNNTLITYRGSDRDLADSICDKQRRDGHEAIVVEVLRDYAIGDFVEVQLAESGGWLMAQILRVSPTGMPTSVHTTQGGVAHTTWHALRRVAS
jgi:hypothetical protein